MHVEIAPRTCPMFRVVYCIGSAIAMYVFTANSMKFRNPPMIAWNFFSI